MRNKNFIMQINESCLNKVPISPEEFLKILTGIHYPKQIQSPLYFIRAIVSSSSIYHGIFDFNLELFPSLVGYYRMLISKKQAEDKTKRVLVKVNIPGLSGMFYYYLPTTVREKFEKALSEDVNENATEELHKFRIPVSWQVAGTVVVEAKNINEAIEIAKDKDGKIPLPEGVYVEDSWQVDGLSPEEILDLYN